MRRMDMHISRHAFRRFSTITAAWGLVFAVVHVYWAAGGDAGMRDDVSSPGAALYVGFVAVLGLVGAAVAYGLDRPWGAKVGSRRLRVLARAGGVALLLGVAVGVGRWAADGSLGDDGAAGVVITAYFLLGAALFAALGWARTTRPGRDVDAVPAPSAMRRT
jgi:hypothetical protein